MMILHLISHIRKVALGVLSNLWLYDADGHLVQDASGQPIEMSET